MKYSQMLKLISISEFEPKKIKVILYSEEWKNENTWVPVRVRMKSSGRISYNNGFNHICLRKEHNNTNY